MTIDAEKTARELWNEAYHADPEQSVPADEILDPALADLRPGGALDLGCGTGRNALKLARQGWSVLGLDWAAEAIAIARATAAEQGLAAQFEVADITNWRQRQLFDLALIVFALPGGANNTLALDTAVAALAPGGVLLVADWDQSMAAIWGLDDDELLTPDQIVALLPDLRIELAEVRQLALPGADAEDTGAASVALVRARKQ